MPTLWENFILGFVISTTIFHKLEDSQEANETLLNVIYRYITYFPTIKVIVSAMRFVKMFYHEIF